MKTLAAVLILGFAPTLFAQEHASLADQKACYEQAQKYVKDQNSKQEEGGLKFELTGAHYDPGTKVCYVQFEQESTSTSADGKPSGVTRMLFVNDAFEGKLIAMFMGRYSYVSASEEKPSYCQVNGEECESRPEFNSLLWKLIPAFRPVQVHYVK